MSMKNWAKREVEIACKRENPNWDGESFDYGCSCYMSALKAYECLIGDGHSGYSFSVTRSILKKLLDGRPLTPITDEDFFSVTRGTEEWPANSEEYLKDARLKSDLQCPRMHSLFRQEDLNGNVTYHDIDRAYCQNVEFPDDTFSCGLTKIVDELFPIKMPYSGESGKYIVGVKQFLADRANGDYDHQSIEWVETPKGECIPVERYSREHNGKWGDCTKEEYERDELSRIDTIENKMISNICYIISDDYEERHGEYMGKEKIEQIKNDFAPLVGVFNHVDPRCRTLNFLRHIASGKEIDDPITAQALKMVQMKLMYYMKEVVQE